MLVLFESVDDALGGFVKYINIRAVTCCSESAAIEGITNGLEMLLRVFSEHSVLELIALVDCPFDYSPISADSNKFLVHLTIFVCGWPPAHAEHWVGQVLVLDMEQGFTIDSTDDFQLSICETDGH
jgi:hypothetical protein